METIPLVRKSLLMAAVLCGGASAPAGVWSEYRFAPDAVREIDLASDTAWTLSIDGGPARPIKVTAGGWNSDQQDPQIPTHAVKEFVTYERTIEIPAEAEDRVTKLLFGGCNYGAEVYLDDKKVAEHHGPMTPFAADVTGVAEPGRTHALRVKAWHRFHYGEPARVPVPFDFTAGVSKVWAGNTEFAYGLTGHVRLAIYPPIHVADVFVRPSVSKKVLAYDVWIANAAKVARAVALQSTLAAGAGASWAYPTLPEASVTLAGGATEKVTVSAPWELGPESYWWPNIPFREEYRAMLHELVLTLTEAEAEAARDSVPSAPQRRLERRRTPLHVRRERFGFVEHGEGPYYYTVNGVRYTSVGDSNSYGQIGEYDCWTETPCFQPPRGGSKGCAETWRRYQRIGFNSMRLSTSVPTRHMLETADEAGYLLVPEGGSWGNGTSRFNVEHFAPQLQETIRACRNHPSVARYSLANESLPQNPASPDCAWCLLIDAALEVDDSRPYVFEVNPGVGTGAVPGMRRGHAYRMQHYDPIVRGGDHIRGMGECAWETDGMAPFGLMAMQFRLHDWAHFAPWSWLNFWPNFLEGMSHERHPWKANNHADRTDNADGWGSPEVTFVQRALDPYLVVDRGLLEANAKAVDKTAAGKIDWPSRVPRYRAGGTVTRHVELFNGGLSRSVLELEWAARWDGPDGELLAEGRSEPLEVEAGFRASCAVEFALPPAVESERTLWLVLKAIREARILYREDRVRFKVLPPGAAAAYARFVGSDEKTQGDWRGTYGRLGHEVAGLTPSLPADVRVDWNGAASYTWAKPADERRALAGADSERIAACRYAEELVLDVELPKETRRLSLYYLDWDRRRDKQEFTITGEDGTVLDRREVAKVGASCYLTWELRGAVRISIAHEGGPNAVASGLFLDPVEQPSPGPPGPR